MTRPLRVNLLVKCTMLTSCRSLGTESLDCGQEIDTGFPHTDMDDVGQRMTPDFVEAGSLASSSMSNRAHRC
jgi:hypothetical protein